MICIDRRVIAAILSLTNNYHDEMILDHASHSIQRVREYREVLDSAPVNARSEDIAEAIDRLISLGYLRVSRRWSGNFSFCMTSLLKHRHAFWWDAFSRRFWGGFVSGLISGIIVTVLGGLLLSCLRAKLGI